MRAAKSARKLSLAVFGGLVIALGATGAGIAASGNADFSLSASPSTVTVQTGQSTGSTINLNSISGFAGNVTLTTAVTSKPSTATATSLGLSLSPTTVSKSLPNASLTVSTTTATPPGNYVVTLSGTGSPGTRTTTVGVTVQAPPTGQYSLSTSPSASSAMLPGSTATYTVGITRTGYSGSVALTTSGLPSGATATFTPASTTGGSSALQVATKNNTAAGSYTFTVTGTASGQPTVTTSATLVLTDSGRAFSITAAPISKLTLGGAAQPIALTLTNPNNQPLSVSNITVSITSVTRAAGITKPCGPGDYVVTQIPASSYPLSVPANNGSLNLGAAGITPLLAVVDDAARNQDGCKGATVNLLFTGTGQGS